MYVVFFAIVGAAAYGVLATADAPHVDLDGPEYAEGDAVTLGDRTYTVSEISAEASGGGGGGGVTRTASIAWTNESAELSAQLQNGSTVPPTDVVWEDQQARHEATIEGGATVAHEGGQYEVSINASAPSVTLTNVENASRNSTFAPGDTLDYRGEAATVTAISSGSVTLVWGNPYLVDIPNTTTMPNVTTPPNVTFVEQRNVTALATADPALYNETVVIDGTRYVTYRENDTNVPVVEYFGPVETRTYEAGDTLAYQGNETTVDSLTAGAVTLTWAGPETSSIELTEGGNFTVQGTQYFAHFPDNSSVQIFTTDAKYEAYNTTQERIDDYEERKLGLWGIAELSLVAIIVLLGTALLPVRG